MTAGPGCRELGGRELARALRSSAAARAAELSARGAQPRLAVVTATDDGGSAAYVRLLVRAAERDGIACDLSRTTTAAGITAMLAQLADDPEVHGIILQTPLPGVPAWPAWPPRSRRPRTSTGPARSRSAGCRPACPGFAPATAEAVLALLDHYGVELAAGTRWWWAAPRWWASPRPSCCSPGTPR